MAGRLVQAAAPIGGNRKSKPLIEPDDRAGDHATPRDAHEPDLRGIHLRKAAQKIAGQNGVSDTVIHPLVFEGFCKVRVSSRAFRTAVLVALPLRRGLTFLFGLTLDRDTDRREALGVPFFHPILEGRAAAAVDQHDAGRRIFLARAVRQSDPCKDSRRLALPIQGVKKYRLHGAIGLEPRGIMNYGRCGLIRKRLELGERRNGLFRGIRGGRFRFGGSPRPLIETHRAVFIGIEFREPCVGVRLLGPGFIFLKGDCSIFVSIEFFELLGFDTVLRVADSGSHEGDCDDGLVFFHESEFVLKFVINANGSHPDRPPDRRGHWLFRTHG